MRLMYGLLISSLVLGGCGNKIAPPPKPIPKAEIAKKPIEPQKEAEPEIPKCQYGSTPAYVDRPPFPSGLAGFRFGISRMEAGELCKQCSGEYLAGSPVSDSFSCEGVPSSLGLIGEAVRLEFCDRKLCGIYYRGFRRSNWTDIEFTEWLLHTEIRIIRKYGGQSCSSPGEMRLAWGRENVAHYTGTISVTKTEDHVDIYYANEESCRKYLVEHKDSL